MRGKGAYTDVRDRSRDTQKGRKMRPYMPFGSGNWIVRGTRARASDFVRAPSELAPFVFFVYRYSQIIVIIIGHGIFRRRVVSHLLPK